ncbi:Hypothetical protein MPV1_49 [Marinitoga phage MPV1]|uniref:Uncharacterized protein n=1 Tax=Marinitoga piezophila (strain DSM 14283 / JCM 11233 / KA3) TaxID=443254 RepID=H2J415_MARPK|nr:hypothetical protein [Marinitoga piezophila]AEX84743.1 hypothetical protein Marpi_0292 [Marinitoga piezophila KA3]
MIIVRVLVSEEDLDLLKEFGFMFWDERKLNQDELYAFYKFLLLLQKVSKEGSE